MKIIKLSTPWNHDFYSQTPDGKGIYGDYKFEIDNGCQECDYWIVWGNLKKSEKVKCSSDCIFYLTDETHEQRNFRQDFLNQFAAIFTPRKDLIHSNIIKIHDLGIWHFKRNFEYVSSMVVPVKEKCISAVSSDLTWLPGHKKRFAFINQLIGHYKNKIDFFGRGINPINDKFDALSPYRYSIAIENSYLSDYFTEKLFECYLTYTLPIYFGCPNLDDYFDPQSYVRIYIDDLNTSIKIIDEVVNNNLFHERLPVLQNARTEFLHKYHVFPALINLLNKNFSDLNHGKKKKYLIKGESFFNNSIYKKVYYSLKEFK